MTYPNCGCRQTAKDTAFNDDDNYGDQCAIAKCNPFAEKAGMQKIAEEPPPKEALKIAEILSRLRFNRQLLGSEEYVLSKLQSLNETEIQTIKEAFIRNCHARFIKYFFCHIPFGRKEEYAKAVAAADLERLARLRAR